MKNKIDQMISDVPVSCLQELFMNLSTVFEFDKPAGIKNLTENVFFTSNKKPKALWYRGHKSSSYNLVPSLYRKIASISKNSITEQLLISKEDLLLDEFSTRNYFRFQYKLPENEFLWMSIMQHHEVSTRLLDWSESLITALFFSLQDFFKDRNYYTTDVPCVWVLNPYQLNKDFLAYSESDKINERIESDSIPSLLVKKIYKDLNKSGFPLAVKSPINSERIQKQSGVFCLFPLQNLCRKQFSISESALENMPGSEKYLMKFTLIEPQRISDELKLIGVKRSMFIPELAETSNEIEEFILR